ncbi:MAG: Asp-tRNA(Asn)/Glu-tRNA(Gln) amidotransferase subunit GatB [Gammaproteobacteria bacterium]
MEWETVIGLEVHAQLQTKAKIFSGASTQYGAMPNTQACEVDLGLPGVLPVLNKEAVNMAIKFGLGVKADIASDSVFARKNYFYPDLPKGYQISQYDLPIVKNGYLDITLEDDTVKRIHLTRAHLEEDAGKSLHEDFHGMTGIDLNRAGTGLLEIVSEPELRSAKEAVSYLKALHALVRYLEICDGNMQEGSFRCDANVSVRRKGDPNFGTRTEIKNVNSFRFVERAIIYEAERQSKVLEEGGTIIQETRLNDADKNETRAMRTKEAANDYRYFPDPDLLPVKVTEAMIQAVAKTMPELPQEKCQRFMKEFELSNYDATVLTATRELAEYFEQVVANTKSPAKLAASWVMGDLAGALNKAGSDITKSPVSAKQLAGLLNRITDNTISGKIAKEVFEAMWKGEGEADFIIESKGLKQMTDTAALEKIISDVVAANPSQLAEYRSGKDKLFAYFVGQVMKVTQGKANPEQVNSILKRLL